MRTTVTLDSDTEQLVRERMARDKVSFKQALNDAIREGFDSASRVDFVTEPVRMGRPVTNLDKSLQVAAELEDQEVLAKLRSNS